MLWWRVWLNYSVLPYGDTYTTAAKPDLVNTLELTFIFRVNIWWSGRWLFTLIEHVLRFLFYFDQRAKGDCGYHKVTCSVVGCLPKTPTCLTNSPMTIQGSVMERRASGFILAVGVQRTLQEPDQRKPYTTRKTKPLSDTITFVSLKDTAHKNEITTPPSALKCPI